MKNTILCLAVSLTLSTVLSNTGHTKAIHLQSKDTNWEAIASGKTKNGRYDTVIFLRTKEGRLNDLCISLEPEAELNTCNIVPRPALQGFPKPYLTLDRENDPAIKCCDAWEIKRTNSGPPFLDLLHSGGRETPGLSQLAEILKTRFPDIHKEKYQWTPTETQLSEVLNDFKKPDMWTKTLIHFGDAETTGTTASKDRTNVLKKLFGGTARQASVQIRRFVFSIALFQAAKNSKNLRVQDQAIYLLNQLMNEENEYQPTEGTQQLIRRMEKALRTSPPPDDTLRIAEASPEPDQEAEPESMKEDHAFIPQTLFTIAVVLLLSLTGLTLMDP